eukprot:CAMPEP_0181309030 /NCGR_PEP_ID=MMETSP1101-20121128/11796_1 /TAXON_ID=46948 /ORGANISM="Rhodomonas abbreviata, Strain Caron Lab Isolate" /LENGTH=160 /DNA_ID=CAMNT_0023415487 /DNA_START=13 /DNA_END=495 /DNA_ORIENTATION=+
MAVKMMDDPHVELKKKIREAFDLFDREGKGVCDNREMGTILRSLSIYPTEAQLLKWLNEVAPDLPSEYFAYDPFEVLCVRLLTEEAMQQKRHTEEDILAAFQALDVEKKGYLEAEQLQLLIGTYGEKFSQEEVKDMMSAAVDVEQGRIYYEDYAELLAAD